MSVTPRLVVRGLDIRYGSGTGEVRAVNDVDFDVRPGELVGLIGESGCGKSTTAMALLRLLRPPGRVVHGTAMLDGVDLLSLQGEALRRTRWSDIAFIPQGAQNSLNPVMRIGRQIEDVICAHSASRPNRATLREMVNTHLASVGLPARVAEVYPHQLSGGMKQRACIAMAVALGPRLIIADEPTSALDVIVQRVVAQTLLKIKRELGVSILMIGHDMGLMAQLADRVAVMYAGHLVEFGPTSEVFAEPRHPYTRQLIESVPRPGHDLPVVNLDGRMPDLRTEVTGCVFRGRCPDAAEVCHEWPEPVAISPEHDASCHFAHSVERVGRD